jgi:hypothetical protein
MLSSLTLRHLGSLPPFRLVVHQRPPLLLFMITPDGTLDGGMDPEESWKVA